MKKQGFTLVEMLTVVAIIALLVGLLIPAVSMVRNTARETRQRSQFAAIEMALLAYKGDFGDYPDSYCNTTNDYCGAQKLAEAIMGWDLLGFHPNSQWTANGAEKPPGTNQIYISIDPANLDMRKERYLELSTANAFRLGPDPTTPNVEGLWENPSPLAANTYVLCDSFGAKQIRIEDKKVTAGTPILYYKANQSSKTLIAPNISSRIYNIEDNLPLIQQMPN